MQRIYEKRDMGVVREELEQQVTVLHDRQKNRSLELKLQYTDALQDGVARLEAELEASHAEREQWASNHAQPSSSSPSTHSKNAPLTIPQTQIITQLRLQHPPLLEEHGSTLASLRRLESTTCHSTISFLFLPPKLSPTTLPFKTLSAKFPSARPASFKT